MRDRKMNIFARDVPLTELMSSIAHVMKFKWKRAGKEGGYTYRLFMDRKTLLDAENQRLREEERLRQIKNEGRQKALDAYSNPNDLSPQDLGKLKSDNPFLYVFEQSGLTKSLGAFFGEVPAAADALASGEELSLSAGSLSEEGQQGLLQAMQSLFGFTSKISGGAVPFPKDLASKIGQVTVMINYNPENIGDMPGGETLLGVMDMFCDDGQNVELPLFDPDSNAAKLLGKLLVSSQDQGKDNQDTGGDMETMFAQAMMSDIKNTDTGEPVAQHKDDPALEAKINIKLQSRNIDDAEAALAEASKMTVVSDSFGRTYGPNLTQDEAQIKVVLDKIADGFRYNWDKPASVIELRDRDWFRKRGKQIPEAWLEAWRQTLKKTGTLDIGDLSQIAVLTQEQYNANISRDEILDKVGIEDLVFTARDVLRLYALLSDGERDALFSEDGLDLRSVEPNAWPLAQNLINRRNASFLQDPNAQIILAASRQPKDKQYQYTITATCAGSDKPIEWKFTTPKYVEPLKKEEPAN